MSDLDSSYPADLVEIVTGEPEKDVEDEVEESSGSGEEEVDLEDALNEYIEVEVMDEEDVAVNGASEENKDPNASAGEARPRKARAPSCPLDVPFSVVRRIMKGAAPNKRFTPELIAAFARGAGTFGLYLLSACQEAALAADRSTIRPIEVVNGLMACGFPEIAEEARVAFKISAGKKKGGGSSVRRKN